MSRFLRIALLAFCLPSAAAWAQTEPADGNAPSDGELSLGTTEGAEPEVGATYVLEEHGDWQIRCVKTEDGRDPCQMYQLLADGEGNSVAEFSLFNLPEGQEAMAGSTVITPLETLLTAQLRIGVDAGQGKRYPFAFCSQIGCFARLGFTAAEIDGFKRGAAATVTIVPAAAPDQTVELKLSLKGFTAGWDAVKAANARTAE
jgi:invasion protein IalB